MPGEVLVYERHPADSMLLLQEGSVDVLVNRGSHKVRSISAPPVQLFGEFSFVDGWNSERTCTLKATSVCYVQCLHRTVVRQIMHSKFPSQLPKFEKLAAQHLYQLPPSANLYLDIPLFQVKFFELSWTGFSILPCFVLYADVP